MPIQPWRKEQAANQKTARRKQARRTAATKVESDEEGQEVAGQKRRQGGKERVPITEEEEEPSAFDGKCRKIRIFPNPWQKDLIKGWMDTAHWTGQRPTSATQAHTTETCTHCGVPNDHVGSSEVFGCADAACPNRSAARDHQGARNNGIRFLTEWAEMVRTRGQLQGRRKVGRYGISSCVSFAS
jgi:hypothetical protein